MLHTILQVTPTLPADTAAAGIQAATAPELEPTRISPWMIELMTVAMKAR